MELKLNKHAAAFQWISGPVCETVILESLENIPDCGHFVPSSLYGDVTRPVGVTKVSNISQDDLFCTSLVKSRSAWLHHD